MSMMIQYVPHGWFLNRARPAGPGFWIRKPVAIIGIKITARTQLGMALVEYVILIGFGIVGLVFVASHHPGTYAMTSTALATIAYYRHRIMARPGDLVWLGVLPLAAAGFLGWIIAKSMMKVGAAENWAILGIVGVGVILMFVARFGLRSPFFGIPRESSDA
jgi:amino acid transporter